MRLGKHHPQETGSIASCIFESLALKYRWVLERAEARSGQYAVVIHVVGGGAQNPLLCQLTANATHRPILASPVEATALGKLMVQTFAQGYAGSLADIRVIVRRSTKIHTYTPKGSADHWDEAFERFLKITAAAPSPASE